jgi:prefoldin beta subunit
MQEQIQISEELRNKIMQLQSMQQQLQIMMIQKQEFIAQQKDIENALNELEKLTEGQQIFKMVGPILVKNKPAILKDELKKQREKLNNKISMLEGQEAKMNPKIQELQKEIQTRLRGDTTTVTT